MRPVKMKRTDFTGLTSEQLNKWVVNPTQTILENPELREAVIMLDRKLTEHPEVFFKVSYKVLDKGLLDYMSGAVAAKVWEIVVDVELLNKQSMTSMSFGNEVHLNVFGAYLQDGERIEERKSGVAEVLLRKRSLRKSPLGRYSFGQIESGLINALIREIDDRAARALSNYEYDKNKINNILTGEGE